MDTVTIENVTYFRSFNCELEPGDVSPFGERIDSVLRIDDDYVIVSWSTPKGHYSGRYRAGGTTLVRQ